MWTRIVAICYSLLHHYYLLRYCEHIWQPWFPLSYAPNMFTAIQQLMFLIPAFLVWRSGREKNEPWGWIHRSRAVFEWDAESGIWHSCISLLFFFSIYLPLLIYGNIWKNHQDYSSHDPVVCLFLKGFHLSILNLKCFIQSDCYLPTCIL